MLTLFDAQDDELAASNRRFAPIVSPFYGRCLVVVAHPDDEVIGCGALLTRLGHVEVVHVTDGSPRRGDHAARAGYATRTAYAAARAREAAAALAVAGVPPERRHRLGLVDQEVQRDLVVLARALLPHVAAARIVCTHAYEGGHPDHDAVAFAVHAAAAMVGAAHRPKVYEMPFYHCGPQGWVRQRFLRWGGADAPVDIVADAEEAGTKRRMAACHATQEATLRQFDRGQERLRLAPRTDFAAPAHDGPLLYRRYGGVSFEAWADLVVAAERRLGLDRRDRLTEEARPPLLASA